MSTLARLYNAFIAMGCGCFSVYYMVAYRDAGLTILMIALVNVVFDVSTTLAELPTSVLFDRWSREKTLMVGAAFRLSGFLMLLVWPASFPVVCAANLATGVGAAVESGATSALYIECSRERDPSLTMRTLMSQLYLITGVSTIAGGLAGALLFLVAPNLIWLGAFVCYTAALPPLVLLLAGRHDGRKDHEEETTPDGPAESSLEGRRGILASVSELFRRPEVWHLVLFNLGTLSVLLFWQLLLGVGQSGVWWLFAGLLLTNAAQIIASRIGVLRPRATDEAIAVVVIVASAAGLAFLPSRPAQIAAFFLFSCAQMFVVAIASAQLHDAVSDAVRSTAFSVVSLVLMAFTAVLTPVCGWIGDAVSVPWASLTTVPLLVMAPVLGFFTRRRHARTAAADQRMARTRQ